MQCPKCNFEISDLAIYCTNCGAQIKVTCPECGASTESGAAFCSQCGERLSDQFQPHLLLPEKDHPQFTPSIESSIPQLDPYERRIVTSLFADIAGYSALSENIDPEYLAEIMGDAYPCFLEPIHEYDGSVVQVMGDGVLAYFGVPLASEDDPERAVLTGLEIVTCIKDYAKRLQQERILENFHVRVGINTGLVVIGEMNPEKHLEYIALGDAVNLAARLQQNAPKDGVLISHSTYWNVRGLFDVQQQAPLIVKGREQVEKTYLVMSRKTDHHRLQKRGLEGVATTMIGREPEMAALKNLYRDAIQGGETALVLISGDPGIGKTRLVNEFAGWVNMQPISPIFLRGRAISSTQDMPYGVLRNLFARSFGILESDTSAIALEKFRKGTENFLEKEQAEIIGQFVGFDFTNSPTISHLLGDVSFSQMGELYLKNYLRNLAENSLLILLEDLHWMDDRTLDFIIEMVTEIGGEGKTQIMVLCTARSQFYERRPKWGEGVPGFTRLILRRLSRLQSRSLIDEILYRIEDIPEAFYQSIVDESGGNPFFIEEMIKMFMDEGVIESHVDPWRIKDEKLADVHVPTNLKGILQARLDSLPPFEKLAVQRAAIIGRTFWDGLLRALTEDEIESQKINSRLESLRDRGLIYHREHSSIAGNQEYLFKHALLCDEAYETVLLRHRRIYHKQVAIWIEENAGDRLEEHLALIANHYLEADQTDHAVDWFIKAGKRALNHCSMPEARVLFEKALSLTKEEDIERIWAATLGHDEAVGTLGDLDARHTDDKTLLKLANQRQDDQWLAKAYFRIGSQARSEGNNQAALRALNQALKATNRIGDLILQALILPLKVTILTSEGDFKTAGTLVEHVLQIAEQTENPNILARALTNLAPYYQAVGDIPQSMKLTQKGIEINQQQGNRLGETFGLINLGYFNLSLGHFTTSRVLLKRAFKIANKLGAQSCEAYSLLNLGFAEWRLGNPQDACEALDCSLDKLEAVGDQMGLAYRLFYLGLVQESANEISEAEQHFTSACDSFKLLGANSGIIEAQAGLARLALKSGDIEEAGYLAYKIINYLDQEGPQGLELPILVYLSCARIFNDLEDTFMFHNVLKNGLKEIEDRLEMIRVASWKEIFLEEIPENRELMAYQREGL